jgi:hypothetical protein
MFIEKEINPINSDYLFSEDFSESGSCFLLEEFCSLLRGLITEEESREIYLALYGFGG